MAIVEVIEMFAGMRGRRLGACQTCRFPFVFKTSLSVLDGLIKHAYLDSVRWDYVGGDRYVGLLGCRGV